MCNLLLCVIFYKMVSQGQLSVRVLSAVFFKGILKFLLYCKLVCYSFQFYQVLLLFISETLGTKHSYLQLLYPHGHPFILKKINPLYHSTVLFFLKYTLLLV